MPRPTPKEEKTQARIPRPFSDWYWVIVIGAINWIIFLVWA